MARRGVCPETGAGIGVVTLVICHHQVAGAVIHEGLGKGERVPAHRDRTVTLHITNLRQIRRADVVGGRAECRFCGIGHPNANIASGSARRSGGTVEADAVDFTGAHTQFGSIIDLLRVCVIVQTIEREVAVGGASGSDGDITANHTPGGEVCGDPCAVTRAAVSAHAYIIGGVLRQTRQQIEVVLGSDCYPVVLVVFGILHLIADRHPHGSLRPSDQRGSTHNLAHGKVVDRRAVGGQVHYDVVHIAVIVSGTRLWSANGNILACAGIIDEEGLRMFVCGGSVHCHGVHQRESGDVIRIVHHTHLKHEGIGGAVRTDIHSEHQGVHRILAHIYTGKYRPLGSVSTRSGVYVETHTVGAGIRVGGAVIDNRITGIAGSWRRVIVVHPAVGQVVCCGGGGSGARNAVEVLRVRQRGQQIAHRGEGQGCRCAVTIAVRTDGGEGHLIVGGGQQVGETVEGVGVDGDGIAGRGCLARRIDRKTPLVLLVTGLPADGGVRGGHTGNRKVDRRCTLRDRFNDNVIHITAVIHSRCRTFHLEGNTVARTCVVVKVHDTLRVCGGIHVESVHRREGTDACPVHHAHNHREGIRCARAVGPLPEGESQRVDGQRDNIYLRKNGILVTVCTGSRVCIETQSRGAAVGIRRAVVVDRIESVTRRGGCACIVIIPAIRDVTLCRAGRVDRRDIFKVHHIRQSINSTTFRMELTHHPLAVRIAAVGPHIYIICGIGIQIGEIQNRGVLNGFRSERARVVHLIGAADHLPFRLIGTGSPDHTRRVGGNGVGYRMRILHKATVGNVINLHVIKIHIVGDPLRTAEGNVMAVAGIADGGGIAELEVVDLLWGKCAHRHKCGNVMRITHHTYLNEIIGGSF